MFRIRKSFLGGNCILQVREDGRWVDADSTPELVRGFRIVGDKYMQAIHDELALLHHDLSAIKATRSEAARKGNATRKAKKLPVLTEQVHSVYTRPR